MRFLLFIILLGFPLGVLAQDAVDPTTECLSAENCPIPYDHLATQETDPFLFSGRLMDENHPRWRQYKRFLLKYPNVRNCLVRKEQMKPIPNLQLLDWSRVGTGRGAEVCIFLIVRSLQEIKPIQKWLEYHEFQVSDEIGFGGSKDVSRFDTQPMLHMYASWTIEQYRTINPSWIRSLTGFELVLEYLLTIQLSEAHQVVGVSVNTPSK